LLPGRLKLTRSVSVDRDSSPVLIFLRTDVVVEHLLVVED
jgi:hypothetical protein